jgi:hypothetical protein
MIVFRLDEARRRSLPNFASLVYRRWGGEGAVDLARRYENRRQGKSSLRSRIRRLR